MNRQSPWHTLLFVLSVLAVLGGISCWPEAWRPDGVKWPNASWLTELQGDDAELAVQPEPEEEEGLKRPEGGEVGLIEFPEGDTLGFAKFARALRSADQQVVRVLHYGDSQIEGDRISADLRDVLQRRFGGMGPGLQGMDPFVHGQRGPPGERKLAAVCLLWAP